MQSNPHSSLNLSYATSFQQASVDDIYVLGADGNLWLEHAVNSNFGQVPPPREQVDGNVQAFQVVDLQTVFVLGAGGNLWLEHAVNGKFGQVPPPREQVDGNVQAFQALDSNTVVVLGTDGNLWMEHAVNGKFGQVPPPREQIDTNIQAFQALATVGSSSIFSTTVLVLDSENNLWMDHATKPVPTNVGSPRPLEVSAAVQYLFGPVPPPREQVETAVAAFQAIDTNTIYVLDTGGTLWLEHSVNGKFGQIPAPREQRATGVVAFQGIDANTVYYIQESESFYGPQGLVDNQVIDFSVTPQIFILGSNGNLWLMTGPSTAGEYNIQGDPVPMPRQQIDGNVAGPTAYGSLRPSYMLLTVIYAPPGTNGGKSASSVEYGTSSSTGSTVSATSSFKAGIDIKATAGPELAKVTAGFSFSDTNTNEVSYKQTYSDSSDLKIPGPPSDGVDHDYDQFVLWLNPLLHIKADTQKNASWVLDIDGEEMHFATVTAGELKNPASMAPGLQQALAAAGLGPGDYLSLLNSGANPFVSVQPNFAGSNPTSPTTIDRNRFQPVQVPDLSYQPPVNASASPNLITYNLTNSVDQITTNTSEVQLGVSLGVTLGVKDIASLDVTDSFTWTTTSSLSTEKNSSQSATLVIGGPAYGYAGSINLNVYWDTIYSTFMFALE
jgi:hypothetical protein